MISCTQLRVKQGIYHYQTGDFVQALEILRPLAEQGDLQAQYYLGEMYVRSSVLPKDYNEAQLWWGKAAVAGHRLAQTKMGLMHTVGYGVHKDLKLAENWFLKAAQSGEAAAQYNLALFYAIGDESNPRWRDSLHWYEQAAKKGFLIAQMRLAQLYDDAANTHTYNPAHARHWYEAINRKNLEDENINLGTILQYDADEGFMHGTAMTEMLVSRYIRQSFLAAQLRLAQIYLHGEHSKSDEKKAFKIYRKLALEGNLEAMTYLGDMFADGINVPKNHEKAMTLYQEAARRNFTPALAKIANAYQNGQGVMEDSGRALNWYKTAAKSGDANAQLQLGKIFEEGKGVEKDFITAYVWYNLAAKAKDASVAKLARQKLETLAEQLSPADLFEAEQRIATEFN